MGLTVKLYGSLKEKYKALAPNGENINTIKINGEKNHRVSDILDKLGISESEISHI